MDIGMGIWDSRLCHAASAKNNKQVNQQRALVVI